LPSPLNSERLIGAVIVLFGLAYSVHAVDAFDLGTLRRIGPGMFPLGLGIAMTLLGIGIGVLAPDADRETPEFAAGPLVLVIAGIAAFALGISYLGLFPAVILCVFVASLAERPFRPVGAAGVAALLCLAAWLIFKLGLGLTLPLVRWPF
jgi:hypothetical protein